MSTVEEKKSLDEQKHPILAFLKKKVPFLFSSQSLFYFVLFIFVLAMAWCAYSLFTNYFTQLYGWDYEHQYVTFYYDYWDTWHDFFQTGHFKLYDHQTFLGTDNIGSNSYYGLFDPFVVSMIFFPRAWIPQMTAVMTFCKLLVCALLMRGYLKYMGIKEWTARLGGLACAFSGFVNFMVGFPSFVSAVTYMPMLLWGIEKVIREKKISILVWALFFEGITCFFLMVPMCVFGVMYAVFRYFQTIKTRGVKDNFAVIGLGILAFALGILMSSWVLLPSVRESSLSGRTASIGRFYLDSILESLKTADFGNFFHLIFEPVGENPGRELMGLISFFYPTSGYLYLPLSYPAAVGGSDYHYDAWTASIFCYTLFAILFFLALMNSIKKKKWSHLIAVALVCFMLFTTSAYYFFFLFSGNGYGRWFFVLIPVIIYYGCWAWDDREDQPKWFMTVASALALLGTIMTYVTTLLVFKGHTFANKNGQTYWPDFYLTAGETKVDSSIIGQTWTSFITSRIWYVYYQVAMVVITGLILIFWNRKKWIHYPLLALMSVEAIVMGNASFAYGSSYSLDWFQGGQKYFADAIALNEAISSQDSSFYRAYFDAPHDVKNYAMGVGFNGSSTFHSLANFNVMDYCRMSHIAYAGSFGKSYGQTYFNPSWSGYYGNKRYATDISLGVKYYAIKRDGYGEWQGKNVPFGSTKILSDRENEFGYAYDVYRNDNIPELGHAVDKSMLYYRQAVEEYPYSEYQSAFFSNYYGTSGSYEVMRNEDFMINGAIIDDKVTLPAGFEVKTGTPFDMATKERIEKKREVPYEARIYVTDESQGDLFLDMSPDYRSHGPNYDLGPAYFLYTYEPQSIYDYQLEGAQYYWIPKDTGHVTLEARTTTGYFNDDPTGAYFNIFYGNCNGDANPIRIFMIGDLFDEDGHRTKENALLNFEYHTIDGMPSAENSYFGNFGFFAEGKVRYIVFETCGPSNVMGVTQYQLFPAPYNLHVYKQERHEAYAQKKNPGDSIESRSRFVSDFDKEDPTDDYLLHDVQVKNGDSFTFKTYYGEDELVVTQIAYDEGWKVKVDGELTETYRINGGFVGFVAPHGEHSYEMHYETPMLKGSLAISVVSFFIYSSYLAYDFIKGELAYKKAKEEAASLKRPED